MLSDLIGLDEILKDISFEDKMGKPFQPFEQLMGCMPPSQAYILPKPYRWLMTDPESPILDFYPKTFTIDMNGKRWPWEAVVLLPFIDSKRLLDAVAKIDDLKSHYDAFVGELYGTDSGKATGQQAVDTEFSFIRSLTAQPRVRRPQPTVHSSALRWL